MPSSLFSSLPSTTWLVPLGTAMLCCGILAQGVAVAQEVALGSAAEAQSVKPGINDRWKTGEVDELVGMLERDGREIYENRQAVLELVAPVPGSRVADVGAGSGFMVELFARRVGGEGKVWGVDINAAMMERLAQRAEASGLPQIATVVCTETSVELPMASVDLVFIADPYHHFEYPAATLASIHRALAADGEMVIVDFERIEGESSDWVMDHVRLGSAEVIAEVTALGFELVRREDAPFLTENYALRFRKVDG